jgi:acyl carrier protein phosphodiesterase
MNYLAHAFLSPPDPRVLAGNLAGDSIRRIEIDAMPPKVMEGLVLHEKIDTATDNLTLFKSLRKGINQAGLPYAGVLADLFIDYALASQWQHFSQRSFTDFKAWVYRVIGEEERHIIEGFGFTAMVLVREDWFESYRTLEGMRTAFFRLNRKTRRPLPVDEIMDYLASNRLQVQESGAWILTAVAKIVGCKLPQY